MFLSVWLEARARRYFDAFFHEASRFAQGLPRREIMPPALGATGMHSRRTFVHCEHFIFGGAGVRCFELIYLPWPVTAQLMVARVSWSSQSTAGELAPAERPRLQLGPKS